jgi:hypothetical protein
MSKKFDKKLVDPVWESVSLRIKKYRPFINTDDQKIHKNFKGVGVVSDFFQSEIVREFHPRDVCTYNNEIVEKTLKSPLWQCR